MKKDSLRTTRSERDRYEYATKLAADIASAFESHQEVDLYERLLDGPTGPEARDGLELMILHVEEIFEQEKWTLPSFEVKDEDAANLDPVGKTGEAIRWAGEKMQSGAMSREQFCLGTTRIIDNALFLSNAPLIVGFHLCYVLHTTRLLRKKDPDKAVNLIAFCGLWLARLVVLLDSERRRRGAMKKMKRDPVQAAKAQAFKLWQERRAGKHPKLRTNSQFAIECMRCWPILTSHDVITGWCTEWTKQAKQKS